MKRILLLSFTTILIFILVGCGFRETETTGAFHLEYYNNEIDYYTNNFPKEGVPETLGFIDSPETAKEKAEAVWIGIYGEDIKSKKPYKVSFDGKNQVWLVQGSLPTYMLGGVPNILIQKADGRILAIWHGK